MLKTQTWYPEPGTEFDEVFEYLVPGEPGDFVRCTRAVIGNLDQADPEAAHEAFKKAHVRANPVFTALAKVERDDILLKITARAKRGGGQGNAPGG